MSALTIQSQLDRLFLAEYLRLVASLPKPAAPSDDLVEPLPADQPAPSPAADEE